MSEHPLGCPLAQFALAAQNSETTTSLLPNMSEGREQLDFPPYPHLPSPGPSGPGPYSLQMPCHPHASQGERNHYELYNRDGEPMEITPPRETAAWVCETCGSQQSVGASAELWSDSYTLRQNCGLLLNWARESEPSSEHLAWSVFVDHGRLVSGWHGLPVRVFCFFCVPDSCSLCILFSESVLLVFTRAPKSRAGEPCDAKGPFPGGEIAVVLLGGIP